MNVFLNIPANSKLIQLLNRRESYLAALEQGDISELIPPRRSVPDVLDCLRRTEFLICMEVSQLASDANLLVGGVK